MRIGSLFSGIGGLELGLEWSGLGHTVWQVEIDPNCRKVLAKHWPNAKRFNDVKEVGRNELEEVDILCGGFPCQDVSSAGTRKGITGSRSGLWFEFARVIRELKPRVVIVENVTSGARLWVDRIRADLGQFGYDSIPISLAASAIGAPYRRSRVFIIGLRIDAQFNDTGKHDEPIHEEVGRTSPVTGHTATNLNGEPLRVERRGLCGESGEGASRSRKNHWDPFINSMDDLVPGVPRGVARRMLGNCVVPQQAEVIGYVVQELLSRM